MDDLDALASRLDAIGETIGDADGVASTFGAELTTLTATLARAGQETSRLDQAFGTSIRRAVDGVVLDGRRLSDALAAVARSLTNAAVSSATAPVADAVGGLLTGRVSAFAKGGVVSGATTFPMRGGLGVMGEAGPEAILPLARGPDGSLGVRSGGGAAARVTINVTTPDAEGFRRSRGQIAAEMSRALAHGARNS